MAHRMLWCFLLLTISLGFSQAQNNGRDPDQINFPGPTERSPNFPLNPPNPRPGMTTSSPMQPGFSTTPSAADFNECDRNCPTTSEYNPVCGSDNTVYSNPGRLNCANNCGRTVQLVKYGRCNDTVSG